MREPFGLRAACCRFGKVWAFEGGSTQAACANPIVGAGLSHGRVAGDNIETVYYLAGLKLQGAAKIPGISVPAADRWLAYGCARLN